MLQETVGRKVRLRNRGMQCGTTHKVSTVTTDDKSLASRSPIRHSSQRSLDEVFRVVLNGSRISTSALLPTALLTSCWKTLTRFRKPEVPGFWPS